MCFKNHFFCCVVKIYSAHIKVIFFRIIFDMNFKLIIFFNGESVQIFYCHFCTFFARKIISQQNKNFISYRYLEINAESHYETFPISWRCVGWIPLEEWVLESSNGVSFNFFVWFFIPRDFGRGRWLITDTKKSPKNFVKNNSINWTLYNWSEFKYIFV